MRQNHGYDNNDPSMHAMFVAHGPFSHDAKLGAHAHPRRAAPMGWHSTSEDAYIIDTFQNVEIYNLVLKLLGVEEKWTAPNNGTRGFWDRYIS